MIDNMIRSSKKASGIKTDINEFEKKLIRSMVEKITRFKVEFDHGKRRR